MVKSLATNAGDIRDMGLIPGFGRLPAEGNSKLLQYSCLENPWTEEPGVLVHSAMKSQMTEAP